MLLGNSVVPSGDLRGSRDDVDCAVLLVVVVVDLDVEAVVAAFGLLTDGVEERNDNLPNKLFRFVSTGLLLVGAVASDVVVDGGIGGPLITALFFFFPPKAKRWDILMGFKYKRRLMERVQ